MQTNSALITRQLWVLGLRLEFLVSHIDGQRAAEELIRCLRATPQEPDLIEMRAGEIVAISDFPRQCATLDSLIEGIRFKAESLGGRRVGITLTWDDTQEGIYERLQASLRMLDSPLERAFAYEGAKLITTPSEWRLELPQGDGERTLSTDARISLGERVRVQQNGYPQIKALEGEVLTVYRNHFGIYGGEHPPRHTRNDVFASVGNFFLRLDPRTGKIEVFQRSARPT
ncbi:hypothetical protein KBD34_01080 [Patescibacteria group bacterium]|nr:hypothetical protein [Patescibacteria group bacterium]